MKDDKYPDSYDSEKVKEGLAIAWWFLKFFAFAAAIGLIIYMSDGEVTISSLFGALAFAAIMRYFLKGYK